jgi:hypothetical protein
MGIAEQRSRPKNGLKRYVSRIGVALRGDGMGIGKMPTGDGIGSGKVLTNESLG